MKKSSLVPRPSSLVFAGGLWASTLESPSPSNLPGAAREVFQDSDFWWKRIERTQSSSWLGRLVSALGEFVARVLQAIWDWLVSIIRALSRLVTGDWSGGSWAIWLVVAVVLAWSLWKLSPVILSWLRKGREVSQLKPAFQQQELPQASLLFDQAALALDKGEFAASVRLALLAVIAALADHGLRCDRTRTNREYENELRPMPELAATFARLARIHERIWYGKWHAERSEAEQALALCRSFLK